MKERMVKKLFARRNAELTRQAEPDWADVLNSLADTIELLAQGSLASRFDPCQFVHTETLLRSAGEYLKDKSKASHAETSPRDGFNKLMSLANETVEEERKEEFKKVIAAALLMGNRTDIADELANYATKASLMGVFNKQLTLDDLRGRNASLVVATIIEAYAYEIARKEKE